MAKSVSGVRFEPDNLAERKLESWPGLIPPLEARVHAAEAVAIATAPVDEGWYKEGLDSDVGYDERGKIIGRLMAKDWKAHWIEFGTEKTRAHHTLRRAMESIGLRVTGIRGRSR